MANADNAEHVELTLSGAPFEVVSLSGAEGVSRLFRFEITCAARADGPLPEALISQPAVIVLRDSYGGERRITGLVAEASARVFDDERAELTVVVRPKIYPLTLGRDCYVLQDLDVIDIARDVLDAALSSAVKLELHGDVIHLEAKEKLTLSAGGLRFELTPGKTTIVGPLKLTSENTIRVTGNPDHLTK